MYLPFLPSSYQIFTRLYKLVKEPGSTTDKRGYKGLIVQKWIERGISNL